MQSTSFEVKYRTGKTNVVVDALSRKPHLAAISTVASTLIGNEELEKSHQEDKYFSPIWEILHNSNATAKQKAQVKNYELIENKIYLREGKRLVVPRQKDIITKILQEAHDNHTSGHLGRDKTYERIARTYYWPRMSKDVKKYVSTCESCQRNKSSNQQPAGLLQTLPTPNNRWEQITMDFTFDVHTGS